MSLGEKWRNNVGDGAPITERDEALCDCADDLESASTPRPPKAEWFGRDGWRCWWVRLKNGNQSICGHVEPTREGVLFWVWGSWWAMAEIVECVPVSEDAFAGKFPTPVSWDVVGG